MKASGKFRKQSPRYLKSYQVPRPMMTAPSLSRGQRGSRLGPRKAHQWGTTPEPPMVRCVQRIWVCVVAESSSGGDIQVFSCTQVFPSVMVWENPGAKTVSGDHAVNRAGSLWACNVLPRTISSLMRSPHIGRAQPPCGSASCTHILCGAVT